MESKKNMLKSQLKKAKLPLAVKLVLITMVSVVVSVASVTIISIYQMQQTFQAELLQQAEFTLDILSGTSSDSLYYLNVDHLSDIAEWMNQTNNVVSTRFYDVEGRIIADPIAPETVQSFKTDPFGQQLVQSDTSVFEWQPTQLLTGRAITAGSEKLGAVSIAFSTAPLADKVTALRNQGFTAALLAVTIGTLLALLLSRSVTVPLQQVVKVTMRIAEGDLTQEICIRSHDEIGVLADAFNNMTAQIRAMISSLEDHARELELRNRDLLTLQSASAAITSSLDLQHVLDTVASKMAGLLEVDGCAISHWNQIDNTVSVISETGPDDWLEGEAPQVYHLADYPLTKRVLDQRSAHQMTIGQTDIDPAELDFMEEAKIKTLLMLPMAFQDRVVGLVKLMHTAERSFTNEEISLAQLLANQAASAIENARLYDELHQQAKELAAINMVSQAINASLDLRQILTLICKHSTRLLGAAAASVALVDTASGELCFETASGKNADFVQGKRLAMGQGLVGWVIQHDQPVLISDVRQDDRFFVEFDERGDFITHSVLCVPLRVKEQNIGAIEIVNKEYGSFNEEDLSLLSLLAKSAAMAIENARLYEQAQLEISERQRAEAALETYAAKLARSNRELKDFAYVASHDLQEPLRKVQALGDRLKSGYGEVLDDRGRDYLNRMQDAAARMQALINGLLTYSRVTTQARPFEPVNLAKVVRDVVADLEMRIERINAQVEVGNLPTIEADPLQMRQLLQNLVGNALKFHRDDGTSVVRVQAKLLNGDKNSPVSNAANGRHCQITVSDNGIGFDEKYVDRIFQVFQRLHGRSQYEGTGIGLATCRKIVERHGGNITAKSTPGQGATFVVTLPVRQPTV